MFSAIVYPGSTLFLLTVFIPDFLDLIVPLNKPRQRKLPAQIEFFIDQERYFYFLLFIFLIYGYLGMTVLMAAENMYMIFVQHSCALFELIR